ncbi:uncharacterized protein LAESUDRAFT_177133 [Laetiporus sulphureus 93-53]|uniref:Uncharacterized protein n=1 Tax=Laetiporus sulphureus 93-53 TaxID=1314785 RepID=A0A165E819_9APHY|nr:uncharacterized protein LAESUDRAFT_177133 [Laetiporus sulphureus 93-53]KZT06422.1 hypothetical protein LAESUDRAFT_177133 [Laetiporus sulphureus 93-53]
MICTHVCSRPSRYTSWLSSANSIPTVLALPLIYSYSGSASSASLIFCTHIYNLPHLYRVLSLSSLHHVHMFHLFLVDSRCSLIIRLHAKRSCTYRIPGPLRQRRSFTICLKLFYLLRLPRIYFPHAICSGKIPLIPLCVPCTLRVVFLVFSTACRCI